MAGDPFPSVTRYLTGHSTGRPGPRALTRLALFGHCLVDVRLAARGTKTTINSNYISSSSDHDEQHDEHDPHDPSHTMLKSLLPSRKLPDAEFTMLTSPVDPAANGKENYPMAGTNVSRLRGEKNKKSKGKEVNKDVPTEQAFDKLLVSYYLSSSDASNLRVGRPPNTLHSET